MPVTDFHGNPISRHPHQEIDPTDPQHWSFIPNHWRNRKAVQQYGDSPNLSLVLPPDPDPDAPWWYDYGSHLKRTPSIDPLAAVLIRVTYEARPKWHPRGFCYICQLDKAKPSEETAMRPPGTIDKDACNGCVLSNYDVEMDDIRKRRDDAYFQFAEAKHQVMRMEEKRKDAQSPGQKKSWVREMKDAQNQLKEAVEACKKAGLNPLRKRKAPVLTAGDQPTKTLESKVVTYVFKRK